jgi:acetyltransferase-like isoleucine patch superfamily enzyme
MLFVKCKIFLKNIISTIYLLKFSLNRSKLISKGSIVLFTQIKDNYTNCMILLNAKLIRCNIILYGEKNKICIKGEISNTSIHVFGSNNRVFISDGALLNNSNIILRGNNCRITIGSNSTFGGVYMVCMGKENFIQIGKECMCAENIDIWSTDSHPIRDESNEIINKSKPVIIGSKVWIGKNSSILKGVTIGDGAIVGMNSVVTKNISNNTLVVGSPQRCLKSGISWEREFIDQ